MECDKKKKGLSKSLPLREKTNVSYQLTFYSDYFYVFRVLFSVLPVCSLAMQTFVCVLLLTDLDQNSAPFYLAWDLACKQVLFSSKQVFVFSLNTKQIKQNVKFM